MKSFSIQLSICILTFHRALTVISSVLPFFFLLFPLFSFPSLSCSVSGCSDHFAHDEVEGLAQLRAMMETLPDQVSSAANRTAPQDPLFPSDELPGLAPNLRPADRELNCQVRKEEAEGEERKYSTFCVHVEEREIGEGLKVHKVRRTFVKEVDHRPVT